MMQKTLGFFILFTIAFYACKDNKNTLKTGLEGKLMPRLNILLMDSTTRLNTSDIPKGKETILLFISPYCPYCKAQTEEIISHIKSLSDIDIYFLTTFPYESIKEFYNHYQLNKYSNITVGQNYDSNFPNYFKVKQIPYMAVYGKDKRLKQVFMGKVKANKLKDVSLN
jgi:hypothetical protein